MTSRQKLVFFLASIKFGITQDADIDFDRWAHCCGYIQTAPV